MRFVILKTMVGDREAFARHLQAHHRYVESLSRRNLLVLAGTFDDRSGGMLLVEADGLEQAIAIAREDPLVQAGVERYRVRGWTQTFDGEGTPVVDSQQMNLPLQHIDTGPITLPPSAENFRVIDVASHPRHAELMARCFAADEIADDAPARRGYLRQSEQGLRKLLLLHGDEVAGQIEFAPPEAAGLPIEGKRLTVINCLWVLDAYTGLGGGCHLLAACAESVDSSSLATIAFNAAVPWLSRGFFERQGFVVVDQVDTGRFFGNTPLVAYLLWRPLGEGSIPPTWDTPALLDGVSFCPGYPWLYGKRLYWGHHFDYHGSVVWEGLRRPEVINHFPQLARQRVGNWTLVKVGVPEADLPRAVDLLQAALMDEPTYFAHLWSHERMVIIFPSMVFEVTRDPRSWTDALQYGLDRSIPREELVFDPVAVESTFR
jgi:uncharacterized protein YciI